MDGIAPGKATVALGSNYLNMTYTPGPGRYTETITFQDIIKDKADSKNYFNTSNGGKLTRKTQWFSADRTKKFATDDKSSPEYKHVTVSPD